MSRPAVIEINLTALKHNMQLVRNFSAGRIVAVVKADAYGHGAIKVSQVLEAVGVDCLAVSCIDEALMLRDVGIRIPILLLEGFFSADELSVIGQKNFYTVIHCEQQLQALRSYQGAQKINVWLKLDSGMHRLGFLPRLYQDAYARIAALDSVSSITLMTHFSSADESENTFTSQQFALFNQVTAGLSGEKSLCNSAGLLLWPEAHGDWVRPGLLLYGISPLNREHELTAQLKPVMRFFSQMISIKTIDPGSAVGYSGIFVASKPTVVGVVAIGYADGYDRSLPQNTPVIIRSRPAYMIGNVSMDMITVDLTDRPDVQVGDRVELWGENSDITSLAKSVNTIAYELLCGVKRAKYVYVD